MHIFSFLARRYPFWLALCFFWGNSLTAFSQPNENSLLWQVSKGGKKQVSYLYGTIHLIPKDSFFISGELNRAIQQTDELVMELDMGGGALAQAMAIFKNLSLITMPGDSTLDDFFSEEEINQILEKTGMAVMPEQTGRKIYPMVLVMMAGNQGCDMSEMTSYELYLQQRFEKTRKQVTGLETVEDQIRAATASPLSEQAAYLRAQLQSEGDSCAELFRLAGLYRQQKIDELMQSVTQEQMGENMQKYMLDDRNARWVPVLKEKMKKSSVLIAVGAGHLHGPEGLIALLRKNGYKVTPLENSP